MEYIKFKVIKVISALTLEQIKPFKKAIMEKKFKSYLNNVFKDKDRLYIDFKTKKSVKKPPAKLTKFLKDSGYDIVDYSKGLAKSNKSDKSNLVKIGKILTKNKESLLLKKFNEDKNRTASKKENLLIVVSRHPYDIAGMSTGRGWTSCMNIDNGQYREYVTKDIENGTLVAYIIDSTDKNINKPISRLLIKPYINMEDKNDIFLYPEKKVYGAGVEGFRDRVIKWLKTFQKLEGTYKFSKEVYEDESDPFVGLGNKKGKSTGLRKLYYKNNPKDQDAKNDRSDSIRETYYRNNPKDQDAKKDKDADIRKIYYKNNPDDKDAKTDEDKVIRAIYYMKNIDDEDAKNSDSDGIREFYYKKHPEDEDAKNDKSDSIRRIYYRNNPEDQDGKKDKDSIVREMFE